MLKASNVLVINLQGLQNPVHHSYFCSCLNYGLKTRDSIIIAKVTELTILVHGRRKDSDNFSLKGKIP